MPSNVEGWLARAAQFERISMVSPARGGEAIAFAISMTTAFYGPKSEQVVMLKNQVEAVQKSKTSSGSTHIPIYQIAYGCIVNTVAEINDGLVRNLRLGIVGEILADLVGLAKEALAEGSIHVAAVLTAASFEDLMRRLLQENSGSALRSTIKLELVLNELSEMKVLQGGEPALAQGFLKFRNDSLHAFTRSGIA